MKGFIKKLLREGLEETPQIKILKKGKIKVGLTKDYVGDEIHVKPKISISETLIDSSTLNFKEYHYIFKIIFTNTDGKKASDTNLLLPKGIPSQKYSGHRKLSEISVDILIYSKKDNKLLDTINVNTYKLENHDENGYLTLPDNVGRVYANGVVKTDDDAAIWLGSKKVYRKGGEGLNSKDNEELYKNWEDKIAVVGKYRGDKYGDIITKDKNYFNWFLQNVTYYEPSPNTKYDIGTTFNANLYDKLKSDGIL